jgi:hypothetical protein
MEIEKKKLLTVKDVKEVLGVSESMAYMIIKELNDQMKASQNVDMTFGDFVDIYIEDMKPRLRENTAPDIGTWQNEIKRHKDAHGNN